MCDKLQARIKGRVLSSLDRNPVVLAAIMIGTEVATFTDTDGYFSFELSASNGDIVLLFQEAQHRHLEVKVDIHHSNNPEINIILEHIDVVQAVDKLHPGFTLELKHREVVVDPDVTVSVGFLPNSLVSPQTHDMYKGPGQLLYSLYSSGNKPDFTSEALKQMVFIDSKGVEFSIQSYVICTMEVVGENGYPLDLRFGTPIALKLTLKFDKNIVESDVSNLHLFVYSRTKFCWLDHGRVGISSIKQRDKKYGTYVTIQQTLRELGPIWTVGFPVRISCYIKAFVTHISSNQELVGATLNVEQADTTLYRPTFYQYSDTTSPGVGVCLKAVCSVGGIIYASVSSLGGTRDKLTAVSPDMDYGIVMGDKEQIMFYEIDQTKNMDTKTPYYLTEEACHSSTKEDKTYFEFTSNMYSANKLAIQPSMLPPAPKDGFGEQAQNEFCFIKVSVYDCAPFTDIKVLSYSLKDHNLLSMNTAVATGTSTQDDIDSCQMSSVVPVRASCVEYTCGSDVHVTVQSQNHKSVTTEESINGNLMDCRYWSSNTAIKNGDHPSQTMLSFHLANEKNTLSGVYRSSSSNLALLQCKSGNIEAPGNSMNPEVGVAVTFTCL